MICAWISRIRIRLMTLFFPIYPHVLSIESFRKNANYSNWIFKLVKKKIIWVRSRELCHACHCLLINNDLALKIDVDNLLHFSIECPLLFITDDWNKKLTNWLPGWKKRDGEKKWNPEWVRRSRAHGGIGSEKKQLFRLSTNRTKLL